MHDPFLIIYASHKGSITSQLLRACIHAGPFVFMIDYVE